MIKWLKDKWNKFTDWCASIAPGLKTKTLAVIGALGSAASVLQEYVTGLPLSYFVTATQAAIITGGLFTLIFFARILTNRAS